MSTAFSYIFAGFVGVCILIWCVFELYNFVTTISKKMRNRKKSSDESIDNISEE